MVRIFNQYVSARSLMLMLAESLLIVLSFLLAVQLRFWGDPSGLQLYLDLPDFALKTGLVLVVCQVCFYCNNVYDLSSGRGQLERILKIGESLGAASLLLGFLYFVFPDLLLGRGVILIGMGLVTTLAMLARKSLDRICQFGAPDQRVVVLGTGEVALEVARAIKRRDDLGMTVVGFVSSRPMVPEQTHVYDSPLLGSAVDLEAIVAKSGASRIIVAMEDRRKMLPTRELVTLRVQGMRVDEASTLLSNLTGRIPLKSVSPSWFIFTDGFHRSKLNEILKRVLDLVVSSIGLVLALPLMALTAVAIKLDSKGPALYRQTRVGSMGENFQVLKFRSMRLDAEQNGVAQWAKTDDPRTTRLGKFLRKYRVDELPQLINVLAGEMSFVGPRPERPEFVNKLREEIPYYDERHSVRPGITGWAQVQYSYGASTEDAYCKLEYDLFYLKNMSVAFDLAIILKTVRIVTTGFGGR